MALYNILLFITSAFVLTLAGHWLVLTLTRIARLFAWKEFVVAFFIMSVAVSIPELFIGITSAIQGIPELSFGNIIGANVIHFTLAIALGTLFLGGLEVESKMVQTTSIYTIIIAILPTLLILDGDLSRIDGMVLIAFFIFYTVWLFSKKDRFTKTYQQTDQPPAESQRYRKIKNVSIFAGSSALLVMSAQGIITSATFFASALNLPLVNIGILIIGLGTALPETYFAISSARNGNSWMIIGNLMGSTVLTATLILGIVALIHPIQIVDFSPYAIARAFLVISAVVFLIFLRTSNRISKREAVILLFIYIAFILIEMLVK